MPQDYNKQTNSNEQDFSLFLNKLNAEIQNVANEIEKLLSKKTKDVSIYDFSIQNKNIDSSKIEKYLTNEKIIYFTNKQNEEFFSILQNFLNDNSLLRENIFKFFNSPLYPIIYDKFGNKPLKEAITFYNSFKHLIKEETINLDKQEIENQKAFLKTYLKNQAIEEELKEHIISDLVKREIKKQILSEESLNIILEALEKKNKIEENNEINSLYQNNLTNYFLKVIGVFGYNKKSKSQKQENKTSPKKQIGEITTWEKGERLYISTAIDESHNFTISIDKTQKITIANFRDFIYLLKEVSKKIENIKNGDIATISKIEIDLDKASKDKEKRKDWTKKDFEATLKAFKSVKIEEGYYYLKTAENETKEERYKHFFKGYIFNEEKTYSINSKTATAYLNKDFTKAIFKNGHLMIIFSKLFTIDTRKNPVAFPIGLFLFIHERRTQIKNGQKRDYNKPIPVDIETLLNNSGRDINKAIKTRNTNKEKSYLIEAFQELIRIGILKEYNYKKENKYIPVEEVEKELFNERDDIGFSKFKDLTLEYKFTDEITEEIKKYNKFPPKFKNNKK